MQHKENADPLATAAVESARLLVSKHGLSRCECCGAFIPSYENPARIHWGLQLHRVRSSKRMQSRLIVE